jgi:hypothetical protein
MEVQEILEKAQKNLGAKHVYAEPYVVNGLTVIPAATVAGGGGESPRGQGGGGFGVKSKPSGAWVIEDGVVRWKAALDLNRIVLGAELVALAGVFALRAIYGPRRSSRRRIPRLARPHVPRLQLPRLRRRERRLPVVHLALPHVPSIRG